MFAWVVQQQYFKDMTDLDIRKQIYEDQMETLEQDMLPFGIIDDGQNQDTFKDTGGQTWKVVEDDAVRNYF
jgi:hypothetical protein